MNVLKTFAVFVVLVGIVCAGEPCLREQPCPATTEVRTPLSFPPAARLIPAAITQLDVLAALVIDVSDSVEPTQIVPSPADLAAVLARIADPGGLVGVYYVREMNRTQGEILQFPSRTAVPNLDLTGARTIAAKALAKEKWKRAVKAWEKQEQNRVATNQRTIENWVRNLMATFRQQRARTSAVGHALVSATRFLNSPTAVPSNRVRFLIVLSDGIPYGPDDDPKKISRLADTHVLWFSPGTHSSNLLQGLGASEVGSLAQIYRFVDTILTTKESTR